jgi:hypothetical protein
MNGFYALFYIKELVMNIQRKETEDMIESLYDSSNIFKTIYFKQNLRMSVFFKTGGVYTYLNIPIDVFNTYDSGESQGKYLNGYIKKHYKVDSNYKMMNYEIKSLNETIDKIKKEIEPIKNEQ